MCGIAGKLDFTAGVDPALLERMCAAMEHRGPNSRGIWCEGPVGLAIQRLAIIDVAGGDQPIFNEDRTAAVVMNGEIYNFQELREQLLARGHRFATRTDTEVLVHLYEDHGDELVDQLRGMFAFAIWDCRRRRLLLGRDRVGKKPLLIARQGGKLWFASEMMALIQDPEIDRTPNAQAIASYLAFQYVPHPLGAFEDVEKLPPGSTLAVTIDGEQQRRYWSLDYGACEPDATVDELEERLRQLIWEATRIRLISEVPLGAFLSGGIDSSAVVAAMADQMSEPVKTFSIGFPNADFDEIRYARMVAERFSTDHHEFVVEPNAIEIMPKLARHYGEPFADPSAIPCFYLAEMTSRHVTVALNGDGGDESFAGYTRYLANDLVAHLNWMPRPLQRLMPRLVKPLGEGSRSDQFRARLQRFARWLAMEPYERYAYWLSAFRSSLRGEMLQPQFLAAIDGWQPEEVIGEPWRTSTANSRIDRMLDVDVNTYLPADLLVKIDIATMAYSVEGRSPLLDHQLMEFAASVPAQLKLQGMTGKRLLKGALRDILPGEILSRSKMGFGVPLRHWFRGELRDLPREVLLGGDSRVYAYVRPAAVRRMIDEHQNGFADHSLRLWVLLQLEMWHREVVESPVRREPVASASPPPPAPIP
jgi:asparagine synthase (glutamine-hydrolysing)